MGRTDSEKRQDKRRELTWQQIELLEDFAKFLEYHGYMDCDWYAEEPKAIDQFCKLRPALNKEDIEQIETTKE